MKVKKEVRGVLEELSEFSFEHSEWAVLVEGKRDVEVLRFFGVKNVIQMKGMNYHSLAESICKKFNGVVILTDLDKKGEEISKKLGKIFKNYGLKTNLYFRNRLKEVGVICIEDIPKGEVWKKKNLKQGFKKPFKGSRNRSK